MPINKVLKDKKKKRQKKITQHLTPHLVLNKTKSKFNLQTKKIHTCDHLQLIVE